VRHRPGQARWAFGARLLAEVGFIILAYDRPTTARLLVVVRGEQPRAVRQKDLDFEFARKAIGPAEEHRAPVVGRPCVAGVR
jgi:hypothetical protein